MEPIKKKYLDRSDYSTDTLDLFTVLGTHIIDIFYNHLYIQAFEIKKSPKNPVQTVTEGYRHAIIALLKAIDQNYKNTYNAKHYQRLINTLNEYTAHHLEFGTLTLSEWCDKVVSEFVHPDYFRVLEDTHKKNIIRDVIVSVIKDFAILIMREHIKLIIDNHDDWKTNGPILTEDIVELFLVKKEEYSLKFLKVAANITNDDKVDKTLVNRIRSELYAAKEENKQCKTRIAELENRLTNTEKRETQQKQTALLLLEKFRSLKLKYDSKKIQHDQLQKKNVELLTRIKEMQDNQLRYESPDEMDHMIQQYTKKPRKKTVRKPKTIKPPTPRDEPIEEPEPEPEHVSEPIDESKPASDMEHDPDTTLDTVPDKSLSDSDDESHEPEPDAEPEPAPKQPIDLIEQKKKTDMGKPPEVLDAF